MKKKDFVEGLIEKTEFPNKGTFAFEDRRSQSKGSSRAKESQDR